MTHATHVIPFRRKREGKTNYKKRLSLLKSGKPRLVVRRSNTSVMIQLVKYEPDGDKVLVTYNSKSLVKHGWKGSTKSVPAAYCAGYLFGQEATKKGVKDAIVDLGLQQHRAGTRIYAAVKGVIDGGLAVPVSEDVFPSAERLRGEHLKESITAVAEKLGVKFPKKAAA